METKKLTRAELMKKNGKGDTGARRQMHFKRQNKKFLKLCVKKSISLINEKKIGIRRLSKIWWLICIIGNYGYNLLK